MTKERKLTIEQAWDELKDSDLLLYRFCLGCSAILRWFWPLSYKDGPLDDKPAPFCGPLCANYYTAGGDDPIPGRDNSHVHPGDFEHTTSFKYKFTLIP
jgi:hypothetical protein